MKTGKAFYFDDPLLSELLAVLNGKNQGEALRATVRLHAIVESLCRPLSTEPFGITERWGLTDGSAPQESVRSQ